MLLIFFHLVLQAAVLLGWGCLFRRLLVRASVPVFMTIWLGWACLGAVLQLAHLVVPLNALALGVAVAVAALGLVLDRAVLVEGFRVVWAESTARRRLVGWAALVAALGLVLGNLVLAPRDDGHLPYDTDLYHLQMVEWCNEYPAVPGLAALHIRLGKHTTWIHHAALWDHGVGDDRTTWLVSALPLWLVLAQWLWVLLVDRAPGSLWRRVYCLLTLPWLLRLLTSTEASLYYDAPAQLVAVVAGLGMVSLGWRWLGEGRPVGSPPPDHTRPLAADVVPLLTLVMLAFTMKQSMAFFTAFASLAVLALGAVCLWQWHRNLMLVARSLILWSALPAFMVAGYLANDVVLSGWLFFPAPLVKVPVPWALPVEDVRDYYHVVKSWARWHGRIDLAEAGLSAWFTRWKGDFVQSTECRLLLLSLAAAFIVGWRTWVRRVEDKLGSGWWQVTLMISGLLWLAAWFFTTPDLRFAAGLFWILFAWSTAFLLAALWRSAETVQAVAVGITMALVAFTSWDFVPKPGPLTLWQVPRAVAGAWPTQVYPPAGASSDPAIPAVHVPVNPPEDRVGNVPLPAANRANPRLRLRDPGHLGSGFYLNAPMPPHPPATSPESVEPGAP